MPSSPASTSSLEAAALTPKNRAMMQENDQKHYNENCNENYNENCNENCNDFFKDWGSPRRGARQ